MISCQSLCGCKQFSSLKFCLRVFRCKCFFAVVNMSKVRTIQSIHPYIYIYIRYTSKGFRLLNETFVQYMHLYIVIY